MSLPARRPTRATRARYLSGEVASIEARLLEAMENLLEEGVSFGSISIAKLMAEVGMTRVTFYKHFESKSELLERLAISVTEDISRNAGPFISDAAISTPQNMRAAVRNMVEAFYRHKAVLAALDDLSSSDPKVAKIYEDMVERIAEKARQSIPVVTERGLVRKGATSDVAGIVTWMVFLYCSRFVGNYHEKSFDELISSIAHICTTTIFKDSSSS